VVRWKCRWKEKSVEEAKKEQKRWIDGEREPL
jgi:hypothetical protein